jgi:hypothetical protein
VVIPGAHPGYITWEEYLRNRERIRQNYFGKVDGKGAPGRGRALLQGLVRCVRCSFRMQVHYRSRAGAGSDPVEELSYRCNRGRAQYLTSGCQTVSAQIVDHLVVEAFLAVLKPAQLDVTLESLRRLDESSKAAEKHWELTIERARYDVERAKRQYDRVEPEDRLVAGELERRWEEKLRELKRAEQEYARWRQEKKSAWGEGQLEELRALVKDVGTLWAAETTTNEDRKELLRLLIDEVWIDSNKAKREVEVRILWKGGSQTIHRSAWWINGRGIRNEAVVRIRELSGQGRLDAVIARKLNEEGFRRCDGTPFTDDTVKQIRCNRGIPKAPPPREPDTYNLKEAAKKLDVDVASLYHWIHAGLLEAAPVDEYGERKVRLTKDVIARLTGEWDRENELDVNQAAEFLAIPVSRVRNMVDDGRLKPRRAVVGRQVRLLLSKKDLQAYKGLKANVQKEV